MASLQDLLRPKKAVSHPEAVGYDRVYGNEMSLFERRQAPLTWMTPYYRPESMVVLPEARVLDREPLRMGKKMREIRAEEMTLFGNRKYREARPLQQEYTDRIREMFESEQRDAERNKTEFRKRRWWHRQADITLRDPVKALRYNNLLRNTLPIELVNARDIVTLQLTGCVVGDAHMSTVAAFMAQTYTLRRLCLQGNSITAVGCKDLVPGIRGCKTLTEIDLSLNPIGDEGCSAICIALLDSGLSMDSKVYSVNMSTCRLTSGSGHHLARLVRENKVIQSLCLWRNMLGELVPGDRSAALKILDELVPNTHSLRVLDLTANSLSDQDVSEHCRMLEANLRRNRLQDIEKKKIVERVFAARKELAEKKATAIWENEKIEVKRLEKEIAADLSRIQTYKRYEERNQTRASKLDEKFLSDVFRHTGGLEVHSQSRLMRLVLNGNFSIQPTTIARLKEYYDVSPVQNLDMFVNVPRRHADLLNYRRRVGDPYETKDPLAHDEHNIFKWDTDKYDPADHHRRRVDMQQYRDEQQRKKEAARLVHFDKFKLNLHGTEEDLKTKKVQVGISVASGVNARIKETQDEDVANGTGAYAAAKQAKLRGNLKDVTEENPIIKRKIELDPVVVVEKASDNDAVRVKQKKDAHGNLIIEVVEGGDALASEEIDNMRKLALEHEPHVGEDPVTVKMRTHIELNEMQKRERQQQQRQRSTQQHAADEAEEDRYSPVDGSPPHANAAEATSVNFRNTGAFSPLTSPNTPRSPFAANDSGPKTPRQLVDEAHQSEAQRSADMALARLQTRQQEVRLHLSRKSQTLPSIAEPNFAGAEGGRGSTSEPSTRITTPRAQKSPRFFTVMGRASVTSGGGGDEAEAPQIPMAPNANGAQRRGTTYVPADAPAALKNATRRGTILMKGAEGGLEPSEVAEAAARAAGVDLSSSTADPLLAAFTPTVLAKTADNADAFPNPEGRLLACVAIIYQGWAAIRERAQVGSPSDAELRQLAEAEANVAGLKQAFATSLKSSVGLGPRSTNGSVIPLTVAEHTETIATFIEDLIKETDGVAYNVELFDALVARLPLSSSAEGEGEDTNNSLGIARLINERGLLGIAACDGSEKFLSRLLPLATSKDGMDVMEIFCSCYYNSLSRIQLTQILIDSCTGAQGGVPHPAITAIINEDQSVAEELAVITQEFFEDVASEKKAVTRENRSGKLELLASLIDCELFGKGKPPVIDLEHESADRHTIVSRALFEGDMPLLMMLLGTPRFKAMINNPNLVKSDNLSLLMVAVIGNHASAVEYFLTSFGSAVNVNLGVKADMGGGLTTAIDLAINLGREARIIELLRTRGARIVGDEIASTTVANGKMTVTVSKK